MGVSSLLPPSHMNPGNCTQVIRLVFSAFTHSDISVAEILIQKEQNLFYQSSNVTNKHFQ